MDDPGALADAFSRFEDWVDGVDRVASTMDKVRKFLNGNKSASAELLQLIMELDAQIVAIQRAQLGLERDLRSARDEQAEAQKRAADFDRYELVQTAGGDFVLALKDGADPGEPPHCICPNCKSGGQKSILQTQGNGLGCPACKSFFKKDPVVSEVLTVGHRSPFDL